MNPQLALQLCGFPERLHPVSQQFLDHFLAGEMLVQHFQRFFSLPNSDYIPLAACLVKLLSEGAPSI